MSGFRFAELQPKDVLDVVFGSIFCGTADAPALGTCSSRHFSLTKENFYALLTVVVRKKTMKIKKTHRIMMIKVALKFLCLSSLPYKIDFDIAQESLETSLEYFKARKLFALHMPSKEGNPRLLQFLENVFKRDVEWVVQLAMDPSSAAADNTSKTIQASTTARLETMAFFASAVEFISTEDAIRLTKAILLRGLFPEIETVCGKLGGSDIDQEMMQILLSSQRIARDAGLGETRIVDKVYCAFRR